MNSFLILNYSWITPLFIIFTTAFASLMSYDIDASFIKSNPIQAGLYQWILDRVGWFFSLTATFVGYLQYLDYTSKTTIKKLNDEINEHKDKIKNYESISETISENIKELFNGFLYKFATSQLNFNHTERITLYIHNNDNKFIPFGRYSASPSFAKNGRPLYPDSEGCIAKGWNEEWHFYQFQNCPVSNEKDYIKEQKSLYQINKNIIENLNMKSSQICVFRLDHLNKPIGVIVVESINPNKFDEDEIKEILRLQNEYLAQMIITLKKYIPNPSNANSIEDL